MYPWFSLRAILCATNPGAPYGCCVVFFLTQDHLVEMLGKNSLAQQLGKGARLHLPSYD